MLGQGRVADREKDRNRDDENHRHLLRQSQREELVVDMVLVRHERVVAVADPVDEHPDDVETRYEQRRNRHHHRIDSPRLDMCRQPHLLDAEETDDKAQREASGIPHEDFRLVRRPAEHIVIEKRQKYAQSRKGYHGIDILLIEEERHAVDQEDDHAQPRRQSVHPVDEVDGIGDEGHGEYGQQEAQHPRKGVYPQQPVEVFNHQPAGHQQDRADNLGDEFLPVLHPDHVVHEADQIEDHHPAKLEGVFRGVSPEIGQDLPVSRHQVAPDDEKHREDDDNVERQSPEAGNGVMMDFPFVRKVKKLLPERNLQDFRDNECRKADT